MQSDIVAKSDRTKSDFFRIRWPKSSDFIWRFGLSDSQIENGIGRLLSSEHVTEHSLVPQQYEVHTDVRVTIPMRRTSNTTTMSERSRRVSPLYS